jgi:hypothetical protein
VIVAHGGYGLASNYTEGLLDLAATREVIALELQGHGHTADIDRDFTFEAFGDDLAALAARSGSSRPT